ncbi:hypothetical protein BSKO_03436 [Bryopsis sp. KO-2023]|nr:hypothetical protein BSKO_03436 [Bryopsis sp. KO-2023]
MYGTGPLILSPIRESVCFPRLEKMSGAEASTSNRVNEAQQPETWGALHHDILAAIIQDFTRQQLSPVRTVNRRWRDVVDSTVTGIRISSRSVQCMGSILNVRKVVCNRFTNLRSLDLMGIPDHNVALFANLTDLTELDLKGKQTMDSGLECLTRLHKLKSLNLWDTSVSDAGMECVGAMSNLRMLDLAATLVGDGGVRGLSKLTGLTSLNLWSTGITDNGLQWLGKMKAITTLDLTSTWIGDRGVKHLVGLSNLTFLDLSCTCVGNRSVQHVSKLIQLTFLGLRNTGITDRCLEHLANLTGLTSLDVLNTSVGNDIAIYPEQFLDYFSGMKSLAEIMY